MSIFFKVVPVYIYIYIYVRLMYCMLVCVITGTGAAWIGRRKDREIRESAGGTKS